MQSEQQEPPPEQHSLVSSLMALTRREEGIKDFWQQYMHHVAGLCHAQQAILVAQAGGKWQVLSSWPSFLPAIALNDDLCQLASRAQEAKIARLQTEKTTILCLCLDVGPQEIAPLLLLDLGNAPTALPSTNTLLLIAALPSVFQVTRQFRQSRADIVFFAEMMKLVGALSEDTIFNLATMRLCNETAALFNCSQVSLGWEDAQGVRVQAISHIDEFSRGTDVVRDLESVMDECADRDSEILWPVSSEAKHPIPLSHEHYATGRKIGALLSLPLRREQQVIGVLCCERLEHPFKEEEIWRLRLLLEQSSRWLSLLEDRSHWFGLRLLRRIRSWFRRQLSFEKTGWKLIAMAALCAVCLLFIDLLPHSVQGTFLLRADETLHISSPIDGFLKTALVEPGDLVAPGDRLLELDDQELLIQKSAMLARLARFYREAEKAKAANTLAEMRIALLMARETEAELKKIAFLLENTRIAAPFKGVIAEGDLRTRIGAPVRKGDLLLKVASLEHLSVKLTISEEEMSGIAPGMEASLSFVGRPDLPFTARLDKIVPNAQVQQNKNSFTVYAHLEGPPQQWWRPGMSGMAKISMGRRSLWWHLSHKIIDFMRLRFWI